MFSHLTDRELAIYAIVIAIFTIKPIPLFPTRHPYQKVGVFQSSQYIQPDYRPWASANELASLRLIVILPRERLCQ